MCTNYKTLTKNALQQLLYQHLLGLGYWLIKLTFSLGYPKSIEIRFEGPEIIKTVREFIVFEKSGLYIMKIKHRII